jgi:putative oxidoreductase
MKLVSAKYSDGAVSFASLLLRLGLGVVMLVAHGLNKLQHFSTYSNGFADPFHLGGRISLSLSLFAELFCSCLVILGLFTRLACIPLVIDMAVALGYAHHGDAFGMGERAAIFLTGFLSLLFLGPGKLSVDRLIGK